MVVDKGADEMNNELTPKIESATFRSDNNNSLSIAVDNSHVNLMTFPWSYTLGNRSTFTVYGLQEADFLKLAQACIDAANELRKAGEE
jgi:hypothetical protein